MKNTLNLNQNSRYYQGFTLIESLIALIVISAFFLLPTLSLKGWQERIQEELFFTRLEKNIAAIQQKAITRGVNTYFTIQKTEISFRSSIDGMEPIILTIPERVENNNVNKMVNYSAGSGNYSVLGKFSFTIQRTNQTVTYRYQLGSGKYVKTIT